MALPSDFDVNAFLERVVQNSELRGMRVVYWDGKVLTTLREGPPLCAPHLRTIVIKPHRGEVAPSNATPPADRESRLYQELIGAGLSCSGAFVGWSVVIGGLSATPVTAGGSLTVAVLGWSAAIASTGQCFVGAVRVINETRRPESNDALDQEGWYQATTATLDAISLLGVVASVGATARMVLSLQRSTGRSFSAILKRLSRQQRRQVAEDLVRAQNPGISNKAMKAIVRAGAYPKRFTPVEIPRAIKLQLKDALGAAISFTGSASGGLVREYVVGVARGFDAY